jgi:hypothetical protein
MRKMELKMETKNEVESMKAEKAYQCKKEKSVKKRKNRGLKFQKAKRREHYSYDFRVSKYVLPISPKSSRQLGVLLLKRCLFLIAKNSQNNFGGGFSSGLSA